MSMQRVSRTLYLPFLLLSALLPAAGQAPPTTPDSAAQSAAKAAQNGKGGGTDEKQNLSNGPGDTKQTQVTAVGEDEADTALGKPLDMPSTAPAPAPPNNNGRPRIGVALGGGGALGLTEIG